VTAVTRTRTATLLLSAGFLLWAGTARAQSVSLVHAASIYADERDRPLGAPEGVACSDDGRLVVSDTGNGRLVLMAFKNRAPGGGTELKLAQLPSPADAAIDAAGAIWVLDRKLRKLARLDPAGAFQGYLEPTGEGLGPVQVGAFALGSGGTTFLLDLAGVQVLVADQGGRVVRRLALPRGGRFFTGLTVDAAGTLYAVDAVRSSIWSAARDATELRQLVRDQKDLMTFPVHIAASRGRLYVSDQNGHGIVVYGIDGSYQGRLLSMGWAEGQVYYPSQICLTEHDELFVADRYNNRLQAFTVTAR
jgi:sugar lactone lactonase YvrE